MTDVDEAILAALDRIVAAAPPPVPAESVQTMDRPESGGFAPRRRLALVATVALMAGMGIGAAAVISLEFSTPAPSSQVETVDDPAGSTPASTTTFTETTASSTTSTASSTSAARQSTVRLAVAEGGWLSEIIPQVANEVPGIESEQLWSALEVAQPQTPFDSGAIAVPADAVAGMSNDRLRWEGLLLETDYTFDGDPDAAEIIAAMHDEFLRVTDELGYERAMEEVGYSPYEVTIIASLIEADATGDADRSKMARVFYNRLAEGLPVGIDPPYFFVAQDRDLTITAETLSATGPYALRITTGLPPTPVGVPSPASLRAAINPTEGPWLFYNVADEAGNLAFASTVEEFQDNLVAAREQGLLD